MDFANEKPVPECCNANANCRVRASVRQVKPKQFDSNFRQFTAKFEHLLVNLIFQMLTKNRERRSLYGSSKLELRILSFIDG